MSKPIYKIVDELPATNMTVRMLQALDWVVPGQWKNVVGFENTVKEVTGESDQAFIQKVGERAIALYNDKSQGYQRALWLVALAAFLPTHPLHLWQPWHPSHLWPRPSPVASRQARCTPRAS